MNDLELAKKEFFAKNWEAGIAAAKKRSPFSVISSAIAVNMAMEWSGMTQMPSE